MSLNRSGWAQRIVRWFANLEVASVATHSLTVGMLLSAMESAGRIDYGHETLLLAILPIFAWAAAQWWIGRE